MVLFDILLGAIFFAFMFWQWVYPLIKGEPVFPIFRSNNRGDSK